VHFVDLKDAGDPVENAAFYQKEGVDELAMLDTAATLENRKIRLEWVNNVSAVINIPLTVGGGIGTLEDIEMVLAAGADKISMNSAAVKNPDLVKQAAERFGSDKITVAVDARRNAAMPSGFELVAAPNRWARMPLNGQNNVSSLAPVLFSPPAWMLLIHPVLKIVNDLN
jgi:cyclase